MVQAKRELCDTTIKVPACCNKDMLLSEDKFSCAKCGKEIKVPQCCGNQVLILTV